MSLEEVELLMCIHRQTTATSRLMLISSTTSTSLFVIHISYMMCFENLFMVQLLENLDKPFDVDTPPSSQHQQVVPDSVFRQMLVQVML